jgi:hypothetical protein
MATLMRCGKIAAEKASEMSETIRKAVAEDIQAKQAASKKIDSMHGRGKGDQPATG